MRRCKKSLTKDINKVLEELKNKHIEELTNKQTEMNNTITEMKNTLEDRMVEFTAAEQNKEKRMKRNEDSLKDF